MYYLLEGIEIWLHRPNHFPELLDNFLISKDCINKKYNIKGFKKVERSIKKELENKKYIISELMNPFYVDKGSTVISVDLVSDKAHLIDKKENKNDKLLEDFLIISDLIKKHNNHLNSIFDTGGNVKMENINGVYFSKDVILRNIENNIAKEVENNLDEIIYFLENNHSSLLFTAMQWIKKDEQILDLFFRKIEMCNSREINVILRQLIPQINQLDVATKEKISKILEYTIKLPSSSIRNKSLSLFFYIPELMKSSKDLICFIEKVSKTKQLNCNYPAKQILKAF